MPALSSLLFLAALVVKQPDAPLKADCAGAEPVVALLPAGAVLVPAFAIADGSRCLKVTVELGGKQLTGYIDENLLGGVESFDQARTQAAVFDGVNSTSTPAPMAREINQALSRAPVIPKLNQALELIAGNRPREAVALLEPLTVSDPRDVNVLQLAGWAAWRSDELRAAQDYWKRALELHPDPRLQAIYAKLQQEAAAGASDKLLGLRVLLRYDASTLPIDTARQLVAQLDSEVIRISAQLGCNTAERLVAVVQSREAYLRATGGAEWSAGLFDGRIHVALPPSGRFDPTVQRTLAHEAVHACLAQIPSGAQPWPAWLHEGLAQKLSGDQLAAAQRTTLEQAAHAHQIPRLEALSQSWSSMNASNARLAYAVALAAADQISEHFANYGIRNILSNPSRLPQITSELDTLLGY